MATVTVHVHECNAHDATDHVRYGASFLSLLIWCGGLIEMKLMQSTVLKQKRFDLWPLIVFYLFPRTP